MKNVFQDGGKARRPSTHGGDIEARGNQIHHSVVMQTAARKLGELSHKLGPNSWASSIWMYHALAQVPTMSDCCPVKLPATLIFVDGDPVEWISMNKKGTSVKLEPASEASIEKFAKFCQLEIAQYGGADADQAVCNMMTSTAEGMKVQGVPLRTLQDLAKEVSVNRKFIFAIQAVVHSPYLFTRGVTTVHENLFLRQSGGIFRHICSTVKYLVTSHRDKDDSFQREPLAAGGSIRPTLTRMNSQIDATEDANVKEPLKVKDLVSSQKLASMNPKVSAKLAKILESYCGLTKKSTSSDANQNKSFDDITKVIVQSLERAYDMWILSIAVHYILDSKGQIWLHKVSQVHTVQRKDWAEVQLDETITELLSPTSKGHDAADLVVETREIPQRLIDNAIAALRQIPEMRQSLDLQSILPILSFCPLLSRIPHTFRVNLARNATVRACVNGDVLPTIEQMNSDSGCLWIVLTGNFACDVDKIQADQGRTDRERSMKFSALDCFGENYLMTSEGAPKPNGSFHCTKDGMVLELSCETFSRIQDSLLKSGACSEKLASAFTAVQRSTLRRILVANSKSSRLHRDLRIAMDLVSVIPFFQNLPRDKKESYLNFGEFMTFHGNDILEMKKFAGIHCLLKGSLKVLFSNNILWSIGPSDSICLRSESEIVLLEADGIIESIYISAAQLFPAPVLRPSSAKRCMSPGWIDKKMAQRPPQRVLPRIGLSPTKHSTQDDGEAEKPDFIAKNLLRPAVKTTLCKLCKSSIATGYDREDTVTVAMVCKSALHMQKRGPVHPVISAFARADISQVDAGKELGLVSTQSLNVCYPCYRILMFEQNLMCQEELFARILIGVGYQPQYESALLVKSAKLLRFYLKIDKFLGIGDDFYRLGKLEIKCIALGTNMTMPFPTREQQKNDTFKECRCLWFFGNSTPLLQYLNSVHDLRISIQTCATIPHKEELEIANITIPMLHIAEKIAMNHEFRVTMGTNFKNTSTNSNTCNLQIKGSFGLQKYNEVNVRELDLEHKHGLYFPRNTFLTEASPPEGWCPLNIEVLDKIRKEVASKWGPKLSHNAIRSDGELLPMSTLVKNDAPLCMHQEWTSRNPLQIRAKSPLKQMLKEREQVQVRTILKTKGRPQSAHNLGTNFQSRELDPQGCSTPSATLAEFETEADMDMLNLMSDNSSDSDWETVGTAAKKTQQKVRAANEAFSNRANKKMEATKVRFAEGDQGIKSSRNPACSNIDVKLAKAEDLLASRSSTESIGDRISKNIATHNSIGAGILDFSHPTSEVPDAISQKLTRQRPASAFVLNKSASHAFVGHSLRSLEASSKERLTRKPLLPFQIENICQRYTSDLLDLSDLDYQLKTLDKRFRRVEIPDV